MFFVIYYEKELQLIFLKRYKEAIDDINNSILIEKLQKNFCAGIIIEPKTTIYL